MPTAKQTFAETFSCLGKGCTGRQSPFQTLAHAHVHIHKASDSNRLGRHSGGHSNVKITEAKHRNRSHALVVEWGLRYSAHSLFNPSHDALHSHAHSSQAHARKHAQIQTWKTSGPHRSALKGAHTPSDGTSQRTGEPATLPLQEQHKRDASRKNIDNRSRMGKKHATPRRFAKKTRVNACRERKHTSTTLHRHNGEHAMNPRTHADLLRGLRPAHLTYASACCPARHRKPHSAGRLHIANTHTHTVISFQK